MLPVDGVLFNFRKKLVSFDSVAAETCNVIANRNPGVNLVIFQISEVSQTVFGLSLINNFMFCNNGFWLVIYFLVFVKEDKCENQN
ncbi:hypothetical protein D3C85_977650 [compost metagenome]